MTNVHFIINILTTYNWTIVLICLLLMTSQVTEALKMLIRLLRYFILSVLSGDLLYLYYNGGWVEPIKWIEVSEVIILWALVFAGSVGLVYQVKREAKR